jgi:hypothetical protein
MKQHAFGFTADTPAPARDPQDYRSNTLREAHAKWAMKLTSNRIAAERPPATRTKADALEALYRANLAIRGARNVG